MMKKLLCLLCAVAMVIGCLPVLASAEREGTRVSNAVQASFDVDYSCYWTRDSDMLNCYNRISLPQNGLLVFRGEKPFDSEGELGSVKIFIYSEDGDAVWEHSTSDEKDDGRDYYRYTVGLAAGSYLVNITPGFSVFSGSIDFTYRFSFIPTAYCEIENNESLRSATPINVGSAYYGCMGTRGDTNETDYYRVDLSGGTEYAFVLSDDAYAASTAMTEVISPSGEEKTLWYDDTFDSQGNALEFYSAEKSGSYFVKIYNYHGTPIPYTFGITEKGKSLNASTLPKLPADELIRESTPAEGRAGTMLSNAIRVDFNGSYSGYWSKTSDHLNYYNRIELPEQGELTITADKPYDSDGEIGSMEFFIYDAYGREMWNHSSSDAKGDGKSFYRYTVGLAAGTYFINMRPGFYVKSGVIDFTYQMSFNPCVCEIERNESFKTATPLVFGKMFSAYFGTRGNNERDFYSFPVQKDGVYRISFDNEKLNPKTAMYHLYSVDGTEKTLWFDGNTYDDNYYPCYDFTAPASGKCYFLVDNYSGEPVKYSVKVTMIQGTCAHSWDKGVVTKAPTCGSEGVRTYTCTACGATKTGSIPAAGDHTWKEVGVEKQPTCKEPGTMLFRCTVCGAGGTTEIPKLTEHQWDEGKETKAASTMSAGEKTYTCTSCGKKRTETIPKREEPSEFLSGDVNLSGKVESADARLALRASVKLENYPVGSYEFRAADVNGNQVIEAGDARTILRASVGLEKLS